MSLNIYLGFNGQCEQAFKFYEKVLGAKITFMMTHKESPMSEQTPPDWQDKIMHASLSLGNDVLMGGDAPPGHFSTPQGFSVSFQTHDPAQAEQIFHALAENGTIKMPIQETFWARRFGMLIDQFGIPWMVNCEKPM